MRKALSIAALFCGLLLLFDGCQKEPRSRSVRFSASTIATKSSYSGVISGNPPKERIDWVDGDVITVYSDAAETPAGDNSANYVLSDVTSSGVKSTATMSNEGDNGLHWDEGSDSKYSFWGVYPSQTLGTDGSFTGNIPSSQSLSAHNYGTGTDAYTILEPSMNYAYMTAAVSNVSGGSSVNLPFTPAFTAFYFDIASDVDVTINSVTISSANAISGNFVASIGTDKAWSYALPSGTVPDAAKTITATLNANINSETSVQFTLFALPVALNALTLTFDTSAGVRTLKLKDPDTGENLTYAPFNKYRFKGIVMPDNFWISEIDLDGSTVREWFDDEYEINSENLPQSSQFTIVGAINGYDDLHWDKNKFRQTWYYNNKPIEVSFKIMTPVNGRWEVVPAGDTGAFTVTNWTSGSSSDTLSGALSDGNSTNNIILKIDATGEGTLYLKTYVYDSTGKKYSLDSETQLLDLRGYHYFVNPQPTSEPETWPNP